MGKQTTRVNIEDELDLVIGPATEAKQDDIISAIQALSIGGGGVQYTEGDTDATITGTAFMWEDAGNTLVPVSSTKPLPVLASIDTTGLATSAKQDTIIGHVDGIEGLLTTIDVDTSNLSTKIDILAGAVSGTEFQVDVLTMPTVSVTGTFWQATQPVSGTFWQATQPVSLASVPSHAVTNAGTFAVQVDSMPTTTVQATNLDIRDLTASDIVTAEIKPLASCGSGVTTVTTAGTQVVLGSSTAIDSVTIKALSTNTGLIYVGTSTVSSTDGFQLSAGDSISLDVDNLTDVYIDSAVNAEGVSYIWVT